jgi:cell division protein ZapD
MIRPVILYEYPFNERIRTYLRLEHLFHRLQVLVDRDDARDHHYALVTLFEIMDVGARADLKSDVLRDLDKHRQQFQNFRGNPQIDQRVLEESIDKFEQHFSALNAISGKAGQSLTENEWLMSIRSRSGIPGGTCSFDLPSYFAWQQQQPTPRRDSLQQWVRPLLPLAGSIALLLQMLRDSGTPQKVVAPNGVFQQNLPQGRTFNLLRLSVNKHSGFIPEISGNRLMVSVRFMRMDERQHLTPAGSDFSFEMALCS